MAIKKQSILILIISKSICDLLSSIDTSHNNNIQISKPTNSNVKKFITLLCSNLLLTSDTHIHALIYLMKIRNNFQDIFIKYPWQLIVTIIYMMASIICDDETPTSMDFAKQLKSIVKIKITNIKLHDILTKFIIDYFIKCDLWVDDTYYKKIYSIVIIGFIIRYNF